MRAGRLAISTTSSSFKQKEEEQEEKEEKEEEKEQDERIGNDRKSRVPSGPGVGWRPSRS